MVADGSDLVIATRLLDRRATGDALTVLTWDTT